LKKLRADLHSDPGLQPTTNNPALHAKIVYGMGLSQAMWEYADHHHNYFPTNLNDALPYFKSNAATNSDLSPDLFRIAYQGTLKSTGLFAHTGELILLIENQPW